MAVLAKVGTLHEHLPSVLVDPCLYYCCTTHQALAALRSLCTEGCARTVRSTCVGVRNVIREFIWTAATLLCAQIRTGFFDAYCTCMYVYMQCPYKYMHARTCTYIHSNLKQRADRLYSVKGIPQESIDPSLMSKSKLQSRNKEFEAQQKELALIEAQIYKYAEIFSVSYLIKAGL